MIGYIDAEAMWSLIDRIVAQETNAGIIRHFAHGLASMRGLDDARLELIILDLAERFPQSSSGDDALTA